MAIHKTGKDFDINDCNLSYSAIKTIATQSVSHFIESKVNPKTSPEMEFGNAAHTFILGEFQDFNDKYEVGNVKDFRCKVGKDLKALAEANGKIAMLDTDFQTLQKMYNSLIANETTRNIIVNSQNEIEFLIKYKKRKLRGFFDGINLEQNYIFDLKTCQNCSNEKMMQKEIVNNLYYLQKYVYQIAYQVLYKPKEIPDFYFIFIEKKPPYACNICKIDDYFDVYSEKLIKRAYTRLETYLQSPSTNQGYCNDGKLEVKLIEAPTYIESILGADYD